MYIFQGAHDCLAYRRTTTADIKRREEGRREGGIVDGSGRESVFVLLRNASETGFQVICAKYKENRRAE